ncbi:hypothetical protein Sme01_20630 [Sphaerisporangium melleum]|uniref:Uncharacterized protein n=1 Tax=Sphaerisporangium melleum TaxID=321316 RepID=A0A917QZD6_9ACTN|nr:hypothetical protein [Sphaerisporangium melleum]GGK76670.1 hypothetical protein GCM10007964_19320 [Sphaerisporangium melleum]GII69587.1 hypothetical protein Sme01_20630 [Sphaerisporangium melleum]
MDAHDDAPEERFTAEEYAFLRFARFGRLPERVLPAEMVEEIKTDRPQDVPEQAFDVRVWGEAGRLL